MADSAVLAPSQIAALTPMQILSNALDRGADVASLEKLMELQERWQRNEARKAFDVALSAAKNEMPTIRKTNEVDFTTGKGRTHYKFEDLASIANAVNPILSKFGLSYRYRTSSAPNEPVVVTCVLSHEQGHSEENTLSAGRDDTGNKNSIQAIGSTVTYLQRYTLKAALGLAASQDDDGQAAGGTRAPAAPPAASTKVMNPDTGRMVEPNSSHQLRKSGAWESFEAKIAAFVDDDDLDALEAWYNSIDVRVRISAWPESWRTLAQEKFEAAQETLWEKLAAKA